MCNFISVIFTPSQNREGVNTPVVALVVTVVSLLLQCVNV